MSIKVIKQNVGIDISKDDFKVCFYQLWSNGQQKIKGSRTFKNSLNAFKALHTWITKKNLGRTEQVRITLEATGVYHESLVHYLHSQDNYYISIVLPNKAKAYFKSYNLKSKTDKIDARALGLMGLERDLRQWNPPTKKLYELRQLTRARVSLVEESTRVKNRLHALMHSHLPCKLVIKQVKQQIKMFVKQIKELEALIANVIINDSLLKKQVERVSKIRGLGLITIATILAETDGLALFESKKQLVSYAGYDVVQEQSGSSINKKGRISKKGNKYIRRALYFPSISMSIHEPVFKNLYERVCSRTNIKKKGLVAVQRKALVILYTLIKKEVEFNPGFEKNKSKQDTNLAYAG